MGLAGHGLSVFLALAHIFASDLRGHALGDGSNLFFGLGWGTKETRNAFGCATTSHVAVFQLEAHLIQFSLRWLHIGGTELIERWTLVQRGVASGFVVSIKQGFVLLGLDSELFMKALEVVRDDGRLLAHTKEWHGLAQQQLFFWHIHAGVRMNFAALLVRHIGALLRVASLGLTVLALVPLHGRLTLELVLELLGDSWDVGNILLVVALRSGHLSRIIDKVATLFDIVLKRNLRDSLLTKLFQNIKGLWVLVCECGVCAG